MSRTYLFVLVILIITFEGQAQSSIQEFDSLKFNKQLEFANQLIDYEFHNHQVIEKFSKMEDVSSIEWFSYFDDNTWKTVGGNKSDARFRILHYVVTDSLNSISEDKNNYDTSKINAPGFALSAANLQFQSIRDTCSIYFSSFVISHPDQTISVWFLPAFQPSGQAIYGCEWEYIFDKSGKKLLSQNSFTTNLRGVWIGEPRELWLNYLNTTHPTIGSIFFALSFRDYFTRIRINTQSSISTTTKNKTGNYIWNHSIK